MYHNFFMHSSVGGHLGCFHVLGIVNSAAMNIGAHVSFSMYIFLNYSFIGVYAQDWDCWIIQLSSVQFSSVQLLSRVLLFATHESQHTRPPCPSPTPRVHPNSCPSSWGCHPAISSSVVPFSSCPQSLPASGSLPMSQLFA